MDGLRLEAACFREVERRGREPGMDPIRLPLGKVPQRCRPRDAGALCFVPAGGDRQ